MPRKKRSRKHKRHHNDRNHFSGTDSKIVEDNVLRTCVNTETSLNSTPTIASNVKVPDNDETPSPDFFFEVPKVLLINNSNKILRSHSSSDVITPNTPIRKRRNISRESSLGHSGLPYLFNLSGTPENVSDLRERSSAILDQKEFPKHRVRSYSSIPKLHSPEIEKVPLKADISTQTAENKEVGCITETPQFNHDSLLDFDYKIKILKNTSLSGYVTPIKRMRIDNITPFSNMKYTAECIQDLNNLQNQQTKYKTFNCSKVLNGESLRKLQNFNEIILNTSQSINYDNCELEEIEDSSAEQEGKHETGADDLSGIENSFFTPQLYNGKLASTPIIQGVDKAIGDEELFPNKVEIVKCESVKEVQSSKKFPKSVTSITTQVEKSNYFINHIGTQTVQVDVKKITPVTKTRVSKERQCVVSVSKRRTYKTLPSTAMYYKISPRRDMRLSPIHRISLERTDSTDTIAAIETFARIFAKVKKYHGRYSSKLPAKIIEICTWLGITIKKVSCYCD